MLQDSNVTLIGRWPNGPCYATFVVGNYCYIGNGGAMDILDISNPASPVQVGQITAPSVVQDIYVSGNYAYVADWSDGLRIIDVSNPASPTETGSFDTGGLARGVYVSGNYAYVVDWSDGLYILRNDLISSVKDAGYRIEDFNLSQNYPNPFNPITTIRYSIQQTGNVKLAIYDILGMKVKTLIDEYKPTGTYEISFDAGSLASGVYFYQIKSGKIYITKKMIYLK